MENLVLNSIAPFHFLFSLTEPCPRFATDSDVIFAIISKIDFWKRFEDDKMK